MSQAEIEMLSLKLVVRKICQLQTDKNATKQAVEGKNPEMLFLKSGLTERRLPQGGEMGKAWGVKFHFLHVSYTRVFCFIPCYAFTVHTHRNQGCCYEIQPKPKGPMWRIQGDLFVEYGRNVFVFITSNEPFISREGA